MQSLTLTPPTPVTDREPANAKVRLSANSGLLAKRVTTSKPEVGLPRCPHWGFVGGCPICGLMERYPELYGGTGR